MVWVGDKFELCSRYGIDVGLVVVCFESCLLGFVLWVVFLWLWVGGGFSKFLKVVIGWKLGLLNDLIVEMIDEGILVFILRVLGNV